MLELAVLVDIGDATFRSSRNGYWTDLSHHPPGISSECRPGRTSLEWIKYQASVVWYGTKTCDIL